MPRKTAKKQEDLYACYVRHQRADKLPVWSKRVFICKFNALPTANRAALERIYRTPYRKLIADAMRVARQALRKFDSSSAHRKQVAREVTTSRRKALQPA